MPQFGQHSLKNKKCLVIGASGFVGKPLCAYLQSQEVFVRVLLRKEQAGSWDERVIGDLITFEQVKHQLFENIDTIFYLASIAHNKAPIEEYQSFNVDLCLRFAAAAIKAGVKRFIYVSSTKAMAEPYEQIVDESFMAWPKDAYGVSKRNAEEGLLQLEGFEHLAILRPCLIYGEGVQGNLYSMMKWIDRGLFPSLPETGAKRSMICVKDVTSALYTLALSPNANHQVYIVTDGNDYSAKQTENILRLNLGKKIPAWHVPQIIFLLIGRCGDLIKNILPSFPISSDITHKLLGPAQFSSKKIVQELHWEPSFTFDNSAKEMVNSYRLRKKNK